MTGDTALRRDIWNQLYQRKHRPWKIDKVISAGESLTGDTTVFFINVDRQCMTGYIGCQEVPRKRPSDPEEYRLHIAVIEGWQVEVPV